MVPALERGLAIIGMFTRGRTSISMPEIVQQLGVSRATAFRLTMTLEANGFIERTPNSHAFRLGPRALSAALDYLYSFDAADIARPLLERLRDEVDATAQLTILDHTSALNIVRAIGKGSRGTRGLPQTRHEAHLVASGQLLLSELAPSEIVARYKGYAFAAYAAPAPQSLAALQSRLKEVRSQGHAIVHGILGSTTTSVALPVRNRSGQLVAAVAVFGPKLAKAPHTDFALQRARDAAALISMGLGSRPAD